MANEASLPRHVLQHEAVLNSISHALIMTYLSIWDTPSNSGSSTAAVPMHVTAKGQQLAQQLGQLSVTQPCMTAHCATTTSRSRHVTRLCRTVHFWECIPNMQSIKGNFLYITVPGFVQGVAISEGAVLFHHLAVPNQKDEHSCTSTSESAASIRFDALSIIASWLQLLHCIAQEACFDCLSSHKLSFLVVVAYKHRVAKQRTKQLCQAITSNGWDAYGSDWSLTALTRPPCYMLLGQKSCMP